MFTLSDLVEMSYVFRIGVFSTLILNIFLETIIVSRYCLKLLSSKNCSYWRKAAFVKIIFASGAPIAFTFHFDSNNFSCQFADDI